MVHNYSFSAPFLWFAFFGIKIQSARLLFMYYGDSEFYIIKRNKISAEFKIMVYFKPMKKGHGFIYSKNALKYP